MKKYLCMGILLGTFVLAGCSANGATEEQGTVKEENLKDVTNAEDVSVIPLDLNKEQKEDYYKKYVEIVKEINAKEGTNHLEVVHIDEFESEDWVEPEQFRQLAEDRATWEFTSKVFGGDPE